MNKLAVIAAALALAACGTANTDTTNVADRSNSAGLALENSAAELEATTDNLVEGEIANITAASNATLPANEAAATNAN
jgi:ABC-type glycerol-3-phosphate transport system substrate-binding protein